MSGLEVMMLHMADFPSMAASGLLRLLQREPLSYRVARSRGSHRILIAAGRPTLLFAFHGSRTVPGWMVRRILTQQVGLSDAEAIDLLKGGQR